jgi:hypothetical protein
LEVPEEVLHEPKTLEIFLNLTFYSDEEKFD